MSSGRIAALAAEIQVNAAKLDGYFTSSDLPYPSFDEDTPLSYKLPPDISAAQEALANALDELTVLNQGGLQTVVSNALSTSIGLKAILKFDIHKLVPLNDGTTFRDLAEKTNTPEKKLTRILRQAIANRIFLEPRPGYIKHSIASKALVEIPILPTCCRMGIYEVGPAKLHAVDAFIKWPDSEEPNHSGWNIANGSDKAMFEFFEDNPDRGSRFKTAMSFLQMLPGLESSYVVEGFDWASLGKATVVDVGGSHGQVSLEIAKKYPDLRFIVQDLPNVIGTGEMILPPELADRITFMAHDFFTEQPVKDAKAYYFRWIFHDWSDKYCIKILKALIPALRQGDRLILSERCLEAPCSMPIRKDEWYRNADMTMFATLNSQERDENDWKLLFHAADTRFSLEEVRRVPGAKLEIIVFRWE